LVFNYWQGENTLPILVFRRKQKLQTLIIFVSNPTLTIMNVNRSILIGIIIAEALVISYLLYGRNKASQVADPNSQTVIADTVQQISQTDSVQDRSVFDDYLKSGTVDFVQLNAAFGAECRTAASFGGNIPANYLQVDVTVKGTNLLIQQYLLDELDYTSRPGCFRSKTDAHTMSNFIPYNRKDSILPFLLNLRSNGVRNNAFEYSVVVKNNKGATIAKFPKGAESLKDKIPFVKYAVLINDTIQLAQKPGF
jgi:hypothetical protein